MSGEREWCPSWAVVGQGLTSSEAAAEALSGPVDQTEPVQVEHDPVSAPQHYRSHPSGVECITITEHMGFNLGNTIKYVWRADLKHDAIEDLRKARWYLDREIARRVRFTTRATQSDVVASEDHTRGVDA